MLVADVSQGAHVEDRLDSFELIYEAVGNLASSDESHIRWVRFWRRLFQLDIINLNKLVP